MPGGINISKTVNDRPRYVNCKLGGRREKAQALPSSLLQLGVYTAERTPQVPPLRADPQAPLKYPARKAWMGDWKGLTARRHGRAGFSPLDCLALG